MANRRVLITGGAGFIGSHLADELLAHGYRVRALDSLVPAVHGEDRARPDHLAPEVELVQGDVRDRAAVDGALNDVDAAGYTPVALGQVIERRLAELVNAPRVTVSVEETKPQTVMVVGEVPRPGSFPYDASATVLQVLATAGGLTQDASGDRIFVLRQTPTPVRIRFSYDRLRRQEGRGAAFRLRPGDVVVVE